MEKLFKEFEELECKSFITRHTGDTCPRCKSKLIENASKTMASCPNGCGCKIINRRIADGQL